MGILHDDDNLGLATVIIFYNDALTISHNLCNSVLIYYIAPATTLSCISLTTDIILRIPSMLRR